VFLKFIYVNKYLYYFGLIKQMVPINIQNFVFSPYKIKSHFLVPETFSFSNLGTKNADVKFVQRLKMLMENFTGTKIAHGKFYRD